MDMLRVGVIGFGYATKTFHVPLILATEGLALAAISTSRPDDVAAVLPNVPCVDSPEALLALPDIDIIVIPTPNDTHFPLAKQAMESGHHVVVDKPFALSVAEASALTALAKEKGVVLSVFHNRRWDSDFMTLRNAIDEGLLGTVTEAELRYDRYRPEVRQRWREQNVPGGGLWYDLGPHLLDQAVQLFGMPDAIQADIASLRPGGLSDDHAQATLFYPQRRVTLHASMLVATETPHYTVNGTQGGYVKYGLDVQEDQLKAGMQPGDDQWGVDPRPALLLTRNEQGGLDERAYASVPGDYRCYYRQFRDAVLGKGDNPVTPEQALRVIYLIEQGIASSQSGARIAIKDIPLS
ncbi:oxidoreductase [Zymobacter sp. IVIA_12111.31 C1]|uniref:oxidoreductase n=1 Tax=Zymobacter sp. IVIA_12111.31 C1 TaxID=3394854 RepID=UPI0039C3D966